MPFDVAKDIAELLTAITTDVYSEMPSDKNSCIVVTRASGSSPEHTFGANTKAVIIHPTIQVIIRHPSADTMLTWIDGVINALDGTTNFVPSGTSRTYLNIAQLGDVLPLGRDDSRRHLESINFTTSIINAR